MRTQVVAQLEALAASAESGELNIPQLARFIATAAPLCVWDAGYPEFFKLWEEAGVHVTPVHFYFPIPDTRTLKASLWQSEQPLSGIDMNEATQLGLLRNCFPRFRTEYESFPHQAQNTNELSLLNGFFDATDALTAYCMVRHFKPRTIIEVGSGYSSLFAAQALAKNGRGDLICIEPYPPEFLSNRVPHMTQLITKKVEEIDTGLFCHLRANDVLFIDSSHTVKIGGDVNYLFFEVLPCLQPGVIVHLHDIFFPFEYRRDWVLHDLRFWAEQYLLQAFLTYNSAFEVLFANQFMAHRHLELFKAVFPNSPWWGGGSFWMRRVEKPDT